MIGRRSITESVPQFTVGAPEKMESGLRRFTMPPPDVPELIWTESYIPPIISVTFVVCPFPGANTRGAAPFAAQKPMTPMQNMAVFILSSSFHLATT